MWEICNLRLIEFIAPLSEREGKYKKKNSKRQDSFFNGKKIDLQIIKCIYNNGKVYR